jgi:divalent metal cation (Fe/Co/Zn/Cd) transporter
MDIRAGHPGKLLHSHWWWVPVVILVGNIISQSFNFRSVRRTLNIKKGNKTWRRFIKSAKEPEHPVVLLETIGSLTNNSLALTGIVLALITRNAYFDALGSALIGVGLVGISFMMLRKTWSMLIGEPSSRACLVRVRAVLASTDGVLSVKKLRTLHLGPNDLMVVAKIVVDSDNTADDVTTIIDRADAAIRRVEPSVTRLYLEPALGIGAHS